jgi:urease accessory protein
VIATALLHIAGIGLGMGLARLADRGVVTRIVGGATAIAGAALILG